MPLTFGSLFAGIGGLDLGLERAGMQCRWQVEIDDYATKVLAKHWPDVHRERDVRACGAHNLAAVDLIAGGFPCQDISYAGRGDGLAGERSGLWYEYARIIRELRPRYVLVENVSALLTRGVDAVLGTLASFGYDAEWHCIPASHIGAPHRRDRIFIMAYTPRRRMESEQLSAKGQILMSHTYGSGAHVAYAASTRPSDRDAGALQRRSIIERSPLKSERCDWWATEPDVGRVADGVPARVDRLKGLGNAVVPQVAEFIGRQIVSFNS